tara:strand:+ start:1077 stop:1514 length:438 start_codon:yes stop_codon:yes gene_type:complete
MIKIFKKISTFIFILFISLGTLNAEPMVVLEFNSQQNVQNGDGVNLFSIDENHSEKYIIRSGDTLASIQKKFYNGSGLNPEIVRLSIVVLNPEAFVKENPNFMFSDKELFLPGKKNIEDLLIGKKINIQNNISNENMGNIFFFGG